MKRTHYIYAALLALPLLAISGCDNTMSSKSDIETVQLDDGSLNLRVTEALQKDALFSRSNISVMSSKGQVTLNGTTNSMQDKNRATEITKKITGVRNVQNNLEIIMPVEAN